MPSAVPASIESAGGIEARGLDGYRTLQQALSAQVSPDEAEQARVLTHQSMRALLVGVAIILALAGLLAAVPTLPLLLAALLAGGVPMVSGMALVTRWRVPFGARLILTLAALLMPSFGDFLTSMVIGPALMSETPRHATTLALMGRLGVAWLVGWAIDSGARSASCGWRRRRWSLSLCALALLLAAIGAVQRSSPWGSVLALGTDAFVRAALLVVWAMWAHGRWAHATRYGPLDVGVVLRAAMTRWQRRLSGRLLATFSVLVIMIALLNGFALPGLLTLDGLDPAVRAQMAMPDGEAAGERFFMWPRQGRLLRQSDFSNENYRFFLVDTNDAELLKRLEFSRVTDEYHRLGQDSGERLQAALAPWRLPAAGALVAALEKNPERDLASHRLWLAERQATGKKASPGSALSARPDEWAYIYEPLSLRLMPATRKGIARYLDMLTPMMLGAGIFACFAFVILWRRGGDFAGARWIGLWFSGIAMSFALPIVDVVYDSTFVRAAQAVGAYQWNITASGLVHLLYGFAVVPGVLSMLGVPLWLAYRHLRPSVAWPVPPPSGRWTDRFLKSPIASSTGAAIGAALAIGMHLADMPQTAGVALAGVWAFVGIATLEALRRRRSQPLPDADPRLRVGKAAIGMLVAAQLLLVLSFFLRTGTLASSVPAGWVWAATGVLAIFAVASTVFLLRSNWLRVSAGRDLSWLITAFLMPVAFEIVNGTLPGVLDAAGVFLPGAASVASLFVVVALMQPIQRGFDSAFAAISLRSLRRIQRRIDALLDDSLTDPVKGELGPQIEKLFGELGVVGYALWVRQGRCAFVPEIDRLDAMKEPLTLSEGLCQRLAHSHAVIDLEAVHSEWPYFFDQFELHRLAMHTRARYLYRVRYGSSLGGLLLLGDSAAALGLARDSFTETASTLGVALSKWRSGSGQRGL